MHTTIPGECMLCMLVVWSDAIAESGGGGGETAETPSELEQMWS